MKPVNFRTLNLNLLRVFEALYAHGNVTEAGHVLGLTQSAVSHSLTQLRAIFEDDLFVRSGSRMLPTARAHELGSRLGQAMEGLREAIEPPVFLPAETGREFRIATGDNVGTVIVSHLAASLRLEAPHARIRVLPLTSDLVHRLEEGQIDVAISHFAIMPERLICDPIWREAPVWMVREGHPALTGAPGAEVETVGVDLGDGAVENRDGYVSRDGLVQWVRTEPIRRDHTVVVPSYLTAMAVAQASDLATLLPRRLAQKVGRRMGLVPLPGARASEARELMAVWSREQLGRRATAWFRSQMLETLVALQPDTGQV